MFGLVARGHVAPAQTFESATSLTETATSHIAAQTPLVVRMPDVSMKVGKQAIPGLPASLPAQLHLTLDNPARHALSLDRVAGSAHPDESRRIERLENESVLAMAQTRVDNFFNVISALTEAFGFSAYPNPDQLQSRRPDDPIRIGLAGKHPAPGEAMAAKSLLPLSKQGDVPALEVFVNALHALAQDPELAGLLPGNMKFMVVVEGIPRHFVLTPNADKGNGKINQYLSLHPEVTDLIERRKLVFTTPTTAHNVIDPAILVVGSESLSDAEMNRQMRESIERTKKGSVGSIFPEVDTMQERCNDIFMALWKSQCGLESVRQRDKGLTAYADELGARLYPRQGDQKPLVVEFFLRGDLHLLLFPDVIPANQTGPGCTGKDMHFIVRAPHKETAYPDSSAQGVYQNNCNHHVTLLRVKELTAAAKGKTKPPKEMAAKEDL